jgi:hypothetical protein
MELPGPTGALAARRNLPPGVPAPAAPVSAAQGVGDEHGSSPLAE